MQDFAKHVLQVGLRILPTGHGVTEKYKVRHHPGRIDADHLTDSSKCGILFVIVSDVSETGAPRSDELGQCWRHVVRTDQTHPADGDGRVL